MIVQTVYPVPSPIPNYLLSGDVITQNLDFMKSHGTALSHDHICATVAGAVYKVNFKFQFSIFEYNFMPYYPNIFSYFLVSSLVYLR